MGGADLRMHCRFVVLGSTGKHYTITLADKPSCECMDFR